MDKIMRSQPPSEHPKRDRIFYRVLEILKSQQEQLETLVKERKILGDRIKMQQERWESDICLYEDHISQMRNDTVAREMNHLFEAAISDMVLGSKHREASLLKLKLEHTDDVLADWRTWFDLLTQNPKCLQDSESNLVAPKLLEGEVRRLNHECVKLASEKMSEVSVLSNQRDFAWHQFKLMESNLTNKLKSKRAEVDQANEKIVDLLASLEQLQSSNNEKDELIAKLKSKVAEMEAGTNKWNEEISRLTQELELLKKSRTAPATPVLNRCIAGARASNLGSRTWSRTTGAKNGSKIVVEKKLPTAQVPNLLDTEKGSRSSKRKLVDDPTLEMPKLFSSEFKVPKLKNRSPHLG